MRLVKHGNTGFFKDMVGASSLETLKILRSTGEAIFGVQYPVVAS